MNTRSRQTILINGAHYTVMAGGIERARYFEEGRHAVLIPKAAIVGVTYLQHASITIDLVNGKREYVSLPRFDNDTYDATQTADLHALYARIRSMMGR